MGAAFRLAQYLHMLKSPSYSPYRDSSRVLSGGLYIAGAVTHPTTKNIYLVLVPLPSSVSQWLTLETALLAEIHTARSSSFSFHSSWIIFHPRNPEALSQQNPVQNRAAAPHFPCLRTFIIGNPVCPGQKVLSLFHSAPLEHCHLQLLQVLHESPESGAAYFCTWFDDRLAIEDGNASSTEGSDSEDNPEYYTDSGSSPDWRVGIRDGYGVYMPDPGRILAYSFPWIGVSWPAPETADTQPASSILEQPDIGTGGDGARETIIETVQQLPGIRKASVVDEYVPAVQKDISLLGAAY
ncbi:hypothetical protein DL89DRAFT_262946 [Linderina pennispora]|uniref:Uncharacterized protein n=1 Tax=Linderina pennispora TaxID=61395 RepID=A0A1Y1VRJ7_9FUNG|nr:uncharacterized protein DL89DRAFT_262946 [Linderina pennispora]ORX63911.1 hypothetical protein DL89DRAFT_262946 [Linderina pennispora]